MKHIFAILSAIMLSVCTLAATTIPLKTGNWVFDRWCYVAIDEFEYSYYVHSTNPHEGILELGDGSQWLVKPMSDETKSFFDQRYPLQSNLPALSFFADWQHGDIVIFHKVIDRDTLLAYNVTRDKLLDLLPIASPLTPQLTITSITHSIYKKNHWNTLIVLSDGTRWQGRATKHIVNWVAGDPVHIAKNPWDSRNTHIFMHFTSTKKSPTAEPVFDRLGVWQAG